MAVLKVTLTKDMLTLISHICFTEFPKIEEFEEAHNNLRVGIDFTSLYGGSFVFEDISYILGLYDKHIPDTENSFLGPEFPKDVEDYMWETHCYIVEHIRDIEDLVHQFVNRGGLVPGTYVCKANERIWELKEKLGE